MARYILLFLFLVRANSLFATDLHLNIVYASSGSINFQWDDLNLNYTVSFSSDNYASLIDTGTLSINSTSYSALTPNTTYFFKVKISTEDDSAYNSNSISTLTYTQLPENLSFSYKSTISSNSAIIGINFNTNNPSYTVYKIYYSTDNFASTSTVNVQGFPPLNVQNLLANTTYSFEIEAIDSANRSSGPSSIISTATLAIIPDYIATVHETSVTLNWTALNSSTSELKSEGYKITVSTTIDFVNMQYGFSTEDNNVNSDIIGPLNRNTTYYYKFGSLNWNGELSYTLNNFTTLTSKPQNLNIISYSSTDVKLGWDAFPPTPMEASSNGYLLEASKYINFSNKLSLYSYDLSQSTLTYTGLDSNTTYYFRVGSLNQNYQANYSDYIQTVTLSIPYSYEQLGIDKTTTSITIYFPSLPSAPESLSASGYILLASTSSDFSNAQSAVSYNINTSNLKIDNLRPNTTYYLKLGTYNRAMIPNYTSAFEIKTNLPSPFDSVILKEITDTTAEIIFSTNNADKYMVEASTDEFFRGVNKTSETLNNQLNTLVISGLSPDTRYYFRAGSLFVNTTVYFNIGDNYTLSPKPSSFSLNNVYISSVQFSWGTSVSKGYSLEASIDSSFSSYLSSMTYNPNLGSLYMTELIPNTSYFFRVASLNSVGSKNYYSAFIATSTLANFPSQKLPFTINELSTNSIRISWYKNSNPDDTLYLLEISSYSDFSFSHSMMTTQDNILFDNLQPNTTFYQKITAINRNNILTGPIDFSPVATLTYEPINPSVDSVYKTSITFSWSNGFNPPGSALYLAEISSANFYSCISSSRTYNTYVSFNGLISNASYYMRVSALNYSNIPSQYLIIPATITYVNVPSTVQDPFSDIKLDGFKVYWSSNTNSSNTFYKLEVSTSSDFVLIKSSLSTSNNYADFNSLDYNQNYHIRVKAIGQRNESSDWVYIGSTGTLSNAQANISVDQDNKIVLPYSYGNIELIIEKGSLGGGTKIMLEPQNTFPATKTGAGRLRAVNLGVKIKANPIPVFNKPAEIVIPYKISDLASDIDRNKLIIASYDDNSGLWVPLKSNSDLLNNKVIGYTYHFSIFQIMELTTANSLNDIKIFPNPYMPNSRMGLMNFTNLPPNTKIKILTINGELIRKLKAGADGIAQWDGKNENGRKVASGVYLAIFDDLNGNKKIKKIVIER